MAPPDFERFEPWFPRSEKRLELTEALLDELERSAGGALPRAYRELLARWGGAALHGVRFPLVEGTSCGDTRTIERLYGFGRAGYDHDVRVMRETFHDRVGELLLPIAADASGNQLCIDVERGDVLFWDRECPRAHEDVPSWALDRLRRDLGVPALCSEDEVRALWRERADALPWWECIYRAADDVESWLASLTRDAREEKRPLEPRLRALVDQITTGARYELEHRSDGTTVLKLFRVDGARQVSMLRGDEWRRLRAVLPAS